MGFFFIYKIGIMKFEFCWVVTRAKQSLKPSLPTCPWIMWIVCFLEPRRIGIVHSKVIESHIYSHKREIMSYYKWKVCGFQAQLNPRAKSGHQPSLQTPLSSVLSPCLGWSCFIVAHFPSFLQFQWTGNFFFKFQQKSWGWLWSYPTCSCLNQ